MDLNLGYRFLLMAIIVAANAFFAAAEAALISVRPSRLKQMAEEGQSGAKLAMELHKNPERMLSAVQVGVTLASLGLGWAGEATVFDVINNWLRPLIGEGKEPLLHAISFAISFGAITYVHVVMGEVVPKNLAIERSDRIAVLLAPPLALFIRLSGPFVNGLERSSGWVSRAMGLRGEMAGPGSHSPEELRFILSSSHKHGLLPEFEERSMHRLLDLNELSTREIMVPRNQIVSVPITAALDDVLRVFQENKYSRIPVYERDPENIHGLVYAKDLLEMWQKRREANEQRRQSPPFELRRFLRKPLVVPESKPVSQLLDEFRHSHAHMALVVDEFGTVVGLVTLEDVMEQIFGEIEDEHDLRPPPLPVIWDNLELDGATTIRDLETQYGIKLPSQAGFETLAGFLLYRLGAIPAGGDRIDYDGLRFTVTAMDRNRVAKVLVENLQETTAGEHA
jgi:CBS domain containing-hemolysin-like protein